MSTYLNRFYQSIQQHVGAWASSTLSNYLLLLLRLLSVFVITRSLFLNLSPGEYGFWALLWSVFGYTLLLDFGFGTAVQKMTSQTRISGDWQRFAQTLSALLLTYSVMAVMIGLVTWLLSFQIVRFFALPTPTAYYQQVFLIFGLGCALIFPTGMAAEMLRGLDRIPARNGIQALALILQTLGTFGIMVYAPNLMILSLFTLGITLLSNLAMFYVVFRTLPEQFKLLAPDFQILKELAGFSLYAWIITLTNLVIFRSDQLVIGSTLGVSLIAAYQIANRLADLFRQVCTPMLDYLGPLAARQYYQQDHRALQQTVLDTTRWVTLIASGLILPLIWYLSTFLHLWLKIDSHEVILSAALLLVSMWVQVSLKSTTTQVMLMSQGHRQLMWAAVAEAVLNLSLSLLLVRPLGILGVALGTFIPNLVLALLFYVPVTCRHHQLRYLDYLRVTLGPAVSATLLTGLLFWPISQLLKAFSIWPQFLLGSLILATMQALSLFVLGLSAREKQPLLTRLPGRPAAIQTQTVL